MGLTSWAAFKQAGKQTMVMGDMVLGEDQVNPVMGVALDNGLEVTALHNHFLWESPIVMFMHIGGMGDEAQVASAVGKVFAKIKETSGAPGEMKTADIDPEKTSFDPKKLDSINAYVQSIRHPYDRGGWGIGHIGPVPEGLVTWLLGAVALIATCMVIGKRLSG